MEIETLPSRWAKSTKDRIPKYLEEFLVNSLDYSVRRSTQSLILSLYKKGNNNQKTSILNQIATKISNIQGKGKTSQQILQLVGQIINLKESPVSKQQQEILVLLGKAMETTFSKWLSSTQFDYFCFCENILNNQGVFKPYLYELNGCVKCCKEVQNAYTTSVKPLSEITESVKYVRRKIQFTLKRTYSFKEFSILFPGRQGPKHIACNLWIKQDNGDLIRKGPINPTQSFEFETNFIQIQAEGPKTGTCIGCNRDDGNSFLCSQCRKILNIQVKYKVVKGSSDAIMKQLGETYQQLALIKRRSYNFYQAIKSKKTMKSLPIDIIETEREYTKLMLNLSLLGESSQRANPEYKPVPDKYTCPSCLYYQVHNFLILLNDSNLLEEIYKTNIEFLTQIEKFLTDVHAQNALPNSIRTKVCKILGTIKHITFCHTKNMQSIHLLQKRSQHLSVRMLQVFKHFFLVMKQNSESQQAKQLIVKYIGTANWSPQKKVALALLYLIQQQDLQLVDLQDLHLSQEINRVVSVSQAEAQVVLSALSFNPDQILTMESSNQLILLLKYLPTQLIPRSDIKTADSLIIPFINNRLPIVPKALPIVLSPQPILPLGDFQNLPIIAKNLSAQDGARLAMQILQFKKYWNFNLYRTLDSCELALNKQEKEKQILLCLKGLNAVEDNFFLDKLQVLLVPKRREFIIKAEFPLKEIELHKDTMRNLIIKQNQIRTTSLPGDTMKEVHDWIMAQIEIKMPTDLIVQNKIIDDLSVPIEVVHRKLYPQTQNKSTPQIIKVIYRVRGIFGQNTEDKLVTQGDDQMNQFLLSAPTLVQPLSQESSVLGLDVLLKLFKSSRHKPDQSTRRILLKIMDIVFKSEAVQIKAIQRNHVDLLIREVLISLASKDEQLAKQKELLLEIVSKLIDRANNFMDVNMRKASTAERKGSEIMDIEDDRTLETSNKNVNLLLDKISQSDLAGMTKLLTPLIRLLPFSSKDVPEISQKIYNYFNPVEIYQNKNRQKLQRMLTFMQALPGAYSSFKTICYEKGFLTTILDSLLNLIPTCDAITDTLMVQNEYGLTLDLNIIKNSVKGCEPLQRQILARGLILTFHKLSVTSSQCTKVVSEADQLIKNLSNKAYVLEEIADKAGILITQFAEEKQKRALAAKQNRLQKQRKKQNLIAQSALKQPEIELTQETKNFEHLKCVSCKQGYGNSNNLLGIYLYSNKAEIYTVDKWWVDPKRVTSGTSVTFFTVIHQQCHKIAHSYDDQKKVEDQKKIGEWEGAQKRNADSKCNSWIPIRGPHNNDDQFQKSARKYFQLNKGAGFWIPLNDLKGLLKKFGNLENLAKDSKSSASSNARLICVQLAFISSFAKKAQNFKQVMEGFHALKDKEIQNTETFSLFLTCLMFNVQFKDFPQYKKLCFDKIIAYASKNQETIFATARPLLIILGMVAEVYRLVHSKIQVSKDILTGIQQYVCKNLGVIEKFQELAILYKNILSKRSSIEQFQVDLFN